MCVKCEVAIVHILLKKIANPKHLQAHEHLIGFVNKYVFHQRNREKVTEKRKGKVMEQVSEKENYRVDMCLHSHLLDSVTRVSLAKHNTRNVKH